MVANTFFDALKVLSSNIFKKLGRKESSRKKNYHSKKSAQIEITLCK